MDRFENTNNLVEFFPHLKNNNRAFQNSENTERKKIKTIKFFPAVLAFWCGGDLNKHFSSHINSGFRLTSNLDYCPPTK